VNRYGNPLKASGVRFKLKQYAAAAGKKVPSLVSKRVSPHRFRHATAVNLVTAEVDVTVIRSWLGHASLDTTSAHRHPGITIVYVLQGEIRSKVGDEPEQTYTAGQMFLETPGQLHAVSRNAGAKPAKLLALLLAETGKQLTTPA